MTKPSEPPYRLRVTAGPLAGARFPLGDSVTIGRSSQVEIFVADAGVSRRHAKVFPTPDGHVLIDLGSANGTLVDGEAISERTLRDGLAFTVGGTTFVYEQATATQPYASARGVYAVSKGDEGATLDRTVVALASGDQPAPRRKAAEADGDEDGWKRVETNYADGSPYRGDLIGDVILYRNLRLRMLRTKNVQATVRQKFEELDTRLRTTRSRSDDPTCSRVFARFACSFPARLRFSKTEGGGFPVEVCDFGVGGARLKCGSLMLDLDELTWLAIDLVSGQGSRTIVFTSRVVWLRNNELGMVFSGAPGWSRHSGGAEAEDTLLVDRDRVPAAKQITRPIHLRLAGNADSSTDT